MKKSQLFTRYPQNPIITKEHLHYQAASVFNPAATKVGDETLLLMRVEDRRGVSHLTIARSPDGIRDWRIDEEPALVAMPEKHPEESWGLEDPRITYLPEQESWAIVYTAYSEVGPLVSLALTKDFRSFERQGPLFAPMNKDAALFPRRFDGKWAIIHRPEPASISMDQNIWISFSPHLKYWGEHKLLLKPRGAGWWDGHKIGLCAPPLETKDGWLMLYHSVRMTASGVIYRLGLSLLDLEDPAIVLCRSDEWIFGPEEDYERVGDVDDVVFPCGWTLQKDQIYMYYGCADTYIGLAIANLNEVLDQLQLDR